MIAAEVTVQSQALTFAAIGGFVTLLTLVLTNRSRHKEKRDDIAAAIAKENRDYARQDAVAAQAAEAARLLLESNVKIAAEATATSANQAVIRQDLSAVRDLGIVTHALVNSDKTAGMKRQKVSFIAQRAALQGQLQLAEQLARTNDGTIPAAVQTMLDVLAEQVKVLTLEIDTLTAEIEARLADQHTAEASVAVAKDVVVSVQAVPPPST